jgi:UDP-N-acetylglucosamine 2-epimerase
VLDTGSDLQIPGSTFMNVLVRLIDATTRLEHNEHADIDATVADDIASHCYEILQAIVQHLSEPAPDGDTAQKLLVHGDTVSLFGNLIRV